MTPSNFLADWPRATERGARPKLAEAILADLAMAVGGWTTFWRAYPSFDRAPVRARRSTRAAAVALRAEQDQADEAALAACIAGTPGLAAVVGRTYTRTYWLTLYGRDARMDAARRQARYLIAAAGPGWSADPEWRTSTVLALVRLMTVSGDFSSMPILADALQDAGCGAAEWLGLMRDPAQPWFRAARVFQTLLG